MKLVGRCQACLDKVMKRSKNLDNNIKKVNMQLLVRWSHRLRSMLRKNQNLLSRSLQLIALKKPLLSPNLPKNNLNQQLILTQHPQNQHQLLLPLQSPTIPILSQLTWTIRSQIKFSNNNMKLWRTNHKEKRKNLRRPSLPRKKQSHSSNQPRKSLKLPKSTWIRPMSNRLRFRRSLPTTSSWRSRRRKTCKMPCMTWRLRIMTQKSSRVKIHLNWLIKPKNMLTNSRPKPNQLIKYSKRRSSKKTRCPRRSFKMKTYLRRRIKIWLPPRRKSRRQRNKKKRKNLKLTSPWSPMRSSKQGLISIVKMRICYFTVLLLSLVL